MVMGVNKARRDDLSRAVYNRGRLWRIYVIVDTRDERVFDKEVFSLSPDDVIVMDEQRSFGQQNRSCHVC